jgi:hypothetical protein
MRHAGAIAGRQGGRARVDRFSVNRIPPMLHRGITIGRKQTI